MAVNKVIYNGSTLIDLTSDTVTADAMAEGETAHAASGARITGTMTAVQYGKSQSLNSAQKAQARTNIGAASEEEVSQLSEAIAEIGTQEEIVQQVTASSEAFIVTELAKRGQLEPEYANSIEECTDTTKLYVLPDGYIYAYMSKTGPMFTDLIPSAIDADGTPYNGGLGYKDGYRFSVPSSESAVPSEVVEAGALISGFIPYNHETIRICGFAGGLANNDAFFFYNESFGRVTGKAKYSDYVNSYGQTFGQEPAFDNEVNTFTFDEAAMIAKSSYYGNLIKNNAKYFRFAILNADKTRMVCTLNEEIAFGTESAWTNTGHAFVPADYEDRIIDLEEASANHEERIKTLEMYGSESVTSEEIPAYIKSAADEVVEKVIEQQGNRSFTMVGISDFHYGGMGDNKDNLIRACKAISYIKGRINIDAIATLGDNIPNGETTADTLKSAHRWFKEINEILAVTQQPGIVDFRTPGNHDRMGGNDSSGNPTEPMPDNAIYSYIGGYNRQCEIGNVPGGWAYKDFNGHKLRVIVLNTCEVEGKGRFSTYSGFHISTAQYNWLIDTLDMSDKADAADWQILILSHHKADDYQAPATNDSSNNYILPNILHAYNTGGSYTGVSAEDGKTVSCNFTGKNAAKLIGQIHGHHHAYIYGLLKLGSNGTQTNVMAISTPTSGFGTGEGHNDDNDGNWYNSVKDTAEETAFCVYCIDLDNHVIQAIHYGNGLDRVIAY